MAPFSLSVGGVVVRISPGGRAADGDFAITGVRHLEDGSVEADVVNFCGKIAIAPEGSSVSSREGSGEGSRQKAGEVASREVIVDAVPEQQCFLSSFLCKADKINRPPSLELDQHTSSLTDESVSPPDEPTGPPDQDLHQTSDLMQHQSSFMTAEEPYVPPAPCCHQLSVEIDDEDDQPRPCDIEHGAGNVTSNGPGGRVCFDLACTQFVQEASTESKPDLSLHEACASDEIEVEDLRKMLKKNPELASVQDEVGDYAAHIFAENDAFIYTECDDEVRQFVMELYTAHPAAFVTEGYSGQIPFAGAIMDWVDDCHTLYARDDRAKEVYRVSEIRTLTKSTRIINSLCVREEVQRLLQLPTKVKVSIKAAYSFRMLSFVLDSLGRSALDGISTRREFYSSASKRRDGIVGSLASLPFLVRTILLIEDRDERRALLDLSAVRNAMFRPESVDIWLVALLSGGERARACAVEYLCLISASSLSGNFGARLNWSRADGERFRSQREELYREISKLTGFLPCMLHLGDSLYEVSTRRAVKYVVESEIGRPLPVYLLFLETFMLLLLMTSYRIIVELLWTMPNDPYMTQHREYWGLAFAAASYFASRDLTILLSFGSTSEGLAWRYASSFGNMVGYVTTISVIAVLSMMYVTGTVQGRNFTGIVTGLLWWKFLLHVKGMSENLSTLIYTIMQIAAKLRYFLAIFLIAIFFFADMIDIVKKTSGECNYDYVDAEMDSGLETFCSLTPLQSYLAMYGIMIGGFEISVLEGSSPLVSLLFVAASFSGVIVLVNILIAIVTGEYEKAQQRSCTLFARARLEEAARQAAREKIINPPDDLTSGIGRRVWRVMGRIKIAAFVTVAEYYLIESLCSCWSLYEEGTLDDFLYVALILCAVLYHMFLAAAHIYMLSQAISDWESLRWLRGSKLHKALCIIGHLPVCRYLTSVGLGNKGELCPDASDMDDDDAPLSRNEFLGKHVDFENNIQEALRASETRMLHAMKSIMMFSQIPSEYEQTGNQM